MSATKREHVQGAFEAIGLASYTFTLNDDELISAARKMDKMLAAWEPSLRLGYAASTADDIDLDSESGVPQAAEEAVELNLALRLASAYGKTPSEDLKANARRAYADLLSRAAKPIQMQYPQTMPVGAGNRWIGRQNVPYFSESAPLTQGTDGALGDLDL